MTGKQMVLGLSLLVFTSTPELDASSFPDNKHVLDVAASDPTELLVTVTDPRTGKRIPISTKQPALEGGEEQGFQGDLLIIPSGPPRLQQVGVFNPVHDALFRPGIAGPDLSYLNRFRAYFSSASGGFGLRIGYDRRIRPDLRLTAGTELLTYGYLRAGDILGDQLPDNITRITLVSFSFGLQQQFGSSNRVIPHIGVAAGPILRFDHHPGLAPGFFPSNTTIRSGRGQTSLDIGVGFEDFPTMSLTAGGFAEAGADVRLGAKRDLTLTVAGRYGIARFLDRLGSPGDFSGFSLSVGFGKYF